MRVTARLRPATRHPGCAGARNDAALIRDLATSATASITQDPVFAVHRKRCTARGMTGGSGEGARIDLKREGSPRKWGGVKDQTSAQAHPQPVAAKERGKGEHSTAVSPTRHPGCAAAWNDAALIRDLATSATASITQDPVPAVHRKRCTARGMTGGGGAKFTLSLSQQGSPPAIAPQALSLNLTGRAARRRCAGGVGRRARRRHSGTPTPNPSPQGGGETAGTCSAIWRCRQGPPAIAPQALSLNLTGRAARRRCAGGVGRRARRRHSGTPTPNPSPQGGGETAGVRLGAIASAGGCLR